MGQNADGEGGAMVCVCVGGRGGCASRLLKIRGESETPAFSVNDVPVFLPCTGGRSCKVH